MAKKRNLLVSLKILENSFQFIAIWVFVQNAEKDAMLSVTSEGRHLSHLNRCG